MNEDAELLGRFAETHAEDAFARLVQRHLGLVYHAALRRTNGDAHLAQDIAQQVFTTLAKEARTLSRHAVLSGWLYVTTRHLAANVMRAEHRRKQREEVAHHLQDTPSLTAQAWDQLRPELDAVMEELSGPDRDAVLLRFFEDQSYAHIGAALDVSEDAARMRVDRALDKLRGLLAHRGIESTAAALGAVLAGHCRRRCAGGTRDVRDGRRPRQPHRRCGRRRSNGNPLDFYDHDQNPGRRRRRHRLHGHRSRRV